MQKTVSTWRQKAAPSPHLPSRNSSKHCSTNIPSRFSQFPRPGILHVL